DLTDMDLEEANSVLSDLGLSSQVSEEEDDGPPGVVLRQDPGSGTVPNDTRVALVVSTPPSEPSESPSDDESESPSDDESESPSGDESESPSDDGTDDTGGDGQDGGGNGDDGSNGGDGGEGDAGGAEQQRCPGLHRSPRRLLIPRPACPGLRSGTLRRRPRPGPASSPAAGDHLR